MEIGKRKYTSVRQLLLPSDSISCLSENSGRKELDRITYKYTTLSNPQAPIGIFLPYFEIVRHTLERILTIEQPVLPEDYPITFQLADGLDGSGSHVIYI